MNGSSNMLQKNKMDPKITVLMPVYNGQKYLREAIESILNQSFKNFEFLIINDGGTDESEEIIKSYNDSRIRFLKNDTNLGLIKTLNIGLIEARGEYIARMDQDDISLPKRLERQVDFMRDHPNIAVCGTWIITIGNTTKLVDKYFTNPDDIKASLLFNVSLAHPSVIIRKSVLDRNHLHYNNEHLYFEDYGLWVELSQYSQLANLPEVLLQHRLHTSNMSLLYRPVQKRGSSLIKQNQLKKLGLHPSEEYMYIHNSLRPKEKEDIDIFIAKREKWLTEIIYANKRTNLYTHESLSKIIYIRWRTICEVNTEGGLVVWKKFVRSPLFYNYKQKKMLDSLKIFVKCLLKKL